MESASTNHPFSLFSLLTTSAAFLPGDPETKKTCYHLFSLSNIHTAVSYDLSHTFVIFFLCVLNRCSACIWLVFVISIFPHCLSYTLFLWHLYDLQKYTHNHFVLKVQMTILVLFSSTLQHLSWHLVDAFTCSGNNWLHLLQGRSMPVCDTGCYHTPSSRAD